MMDKEYEAITFRPMRRLHDSGYRLMTDKEGNEYDYVGVEIPTPEGSSVTIAVDCQKDGWLNFYVISSNYDIEKNKHHPLLGGKLRRISQQNISKGINE